MSLKIHLNWFPLSGNEQIIHYLPSLSSRGQPCRWCHRSRRQRKLSAPATPTQQKVYLERGRRGEGAGTTQPLVCADEWSDPLPPTAQHSTAHLPSLLLQECLPADGLSCWIPIRSGPGSASPVSIPPSPSLLIKFSHSCSLSPCVLTFQSADRYACVRLCFTTTTVV